MSGIIDSRDLATELDELAERAAAVADAEANPDDYTDEDRAELDPLDEDEAIRLAALRDFADAVGSEWPHGETLIPEDEFVGYAEQLAEDVGYLDSEAATSWPLRHIDWEAAAGELRQDYSEHDFDGVTYLFRV